MFGAKIGKKCIIVQFLVVEKDGKALNAEFAESRRIGTEKRSESAERGRRKDSRSENVSYPPGPADGVPYETKKRRRGLR